MGGQPGSAFEGRTEPLEDDVTGVAGLTATSLDGTKRHYGLVPEGDVRAIV